MKIKVPLRLAAAGNAHPRRIELFDSLFFVDTHRKGLGCIFFRCGGRKLRCCRRGSRQAALIRAAFYYSSPFPGKKYGIGFGLSHIFCVRTLILLRTDPRGSFL